MCAYKINAPVASCLRLCDPKNLNNIPKPVIRFFKSIHKDLQTKQNNLNKEDLKKLYKLYLQIKVLQRKIKLGEFYDCFYSGEKEVLYFTFYAFQRKVNLKNLELIYTIAE